MRCIEFLPLCFFGIPNFGIGIPISQFFNSGIREKNSDRSLRNQKRNKNSTSNGGPRNRNENLEFTTKLLPPPLPLTATRVKCSMPQGWTSCSIFVRSIWKWRVDLWRLATIKASALFLQVAAAAANNKHSPYSKEKNGRSAHFNWREE
jgi:hypothetical protein